MEAPGFKKVIRPNLTLAMRGQLQIDIQLEVGGVNESITVSKNRSESVGGTESITITKARTESVGEDETVNVTKKRSHTIGDDETLSVGGKRSASGSVPA